MKGKIYPISGEVATHFLLPLHYSGRIPTISRAFCWYYDGIIQAVCTFGKPASPFLCEGICGKEEAEHVYELNRLCRLDDWQEPLSEFVGYCLRSLKKENWIVVSFSDTGMNHHGYIYQACNFLYTGCTNERTDKYAGEGKHSRHYDNFESEQYRVLRTAKHRYVYFCAKSRKQKKIWMDKLNYPIVPYPKGDNSNYVLGEFMKPTLVPVGESEREE